ncbi:MAG: hypothetical protein AAFP03_02910, partial [Cyanobacteria bacterium J06598_3]
LEAEGIIPRGTVERSVAHTGYSVYAKKDKSLVSAKNLVANFLNQRSVVFKPNYTQYEINGREVTPHLIAEVDANGNPKAIAHVVGAAEVYRTEDLKDLADLVGPDGHVIIFIDRTAYKSGPILEADILWPQFTIEEIPWDSKTGERVIEYR